jgi:hypothetical protein
LPLGRLFVNEAQPRKPRIRGERLTVLLPSLDLCAGATRRIGGRIIATARARIEGRHARRAAIRMPVQIFCNDTAIAVRPFDSRPAPACGSIPRIELLNRLSEETREFRIVRAGDPTENGLFERGVEILHPTRNFWGIRFPDEPPLRA